MVVTRRLKDWGGLQHTAELNPPGIAVLPLSFCRTFEHKKVQRLQGNYKQPPNLLAIHSKSLSQIENSVTIP
jgi:hypothetical protein